MGLLLITHDLGVIAQICDTVAVMYAGSVVESGKVETLFSRPRHPYTQALLQCVPKLGMKEGELTAIGGNVPSVRGFPKGCRFNPRCPDARGRCRTTRPPVFETAAGTKVACHKYEAGAGV